MLTVSVPGHLVNLTEVGVVYRYRADRVQVSGHHVPPEWIPGEHHLRTPLRRIVLARRLEREEELDHVAEGLRAVLETLRPEAACRIVPEEVVGYIEKGT